MDRKATPLFYIAFNSLQEVKFHKEKPIFLTYRKSNFRDFKDIFIERLFKVIAVL